MKQSRVTSPKITAFLKEQCGWSRGIRYVLEKYGLNFEEKQIHIPENYEEMVLISGQPLQPTLIIDGNIVVDISGQELEEYLLAEKYIHSRIKENTVDLDAPCSEEEHQQMNQSDSQTVSMTMTKNNMGGFTL